jgi:hypothetical protein
MTTCESRSLRLFPGYNDLRSGYLPMDVHLSVLDQALAGHFFGLRKTHDGQTRRRDIGQAPVVAGDIELALVAGDDEGHRVGRLLACIVDGLDGLVGGGDGLDGGIKVTGVTDLSR